LGVGEQECVFLFVANNPRLKGLAPLCRSLARLKEKNWRLVILGKGRIHGRAKLEMRPIRGRVRIVGKTLDPSAYYAAGDALIHPTFYDPCANVTVEALASGLPVVTSAFDGASELITPGREGFILRWPRDEDALSRHLEALLDPDRRREMGAAARARAEENTFASRLAEYVDLLQAVAVDDSERRRERCGKDARKPC
jgi:UDP-glucose:(heptosyl)LPS alpha-1,3-glucosyltransferase